MKLIIEDDAGRKTIVPFVREELTIGRQEGNTIRLTERNVSRRHARLVRQNGHVRIEDLGSYNGIRINGEKIQGPVQVRDGDRIQIGNYDLTIQSEATAPSLVPPSPPAHQPQPSHETTKQPLSPSTVERTSRRAPASGKETRPRLVDIAPEDAPRLIVLNTPLAGREFACLRSELRIGRTSDNDIALDHRSLSRSHAKLVREDGNKWRVLDLSSANGLLVNGERYAQATLNNGDVIDLGHVKVKFLAPGESFRARGGNRLGLWLGLGLLMGLVVLGGIWVVSPRFRELLCQYRHSSYQPGSKDSTSAAGR